MKNKISRIPVRSDPFSSLKRPQTVRYFRCFLFVFIYIHILFLKFLSRKQLQNNIKQTFYLFYERNKQAFVLQFSYNSAISVNLLSVMHVYLTQKITILFCGNFILTSTPKFSNTKSTAALIHHLHCMVIYFETYIYKRFDQDVIILHVVSNR